jgi:cyclophilin family peptidyl-prolyl cis-trans isomerase
MQRVAFSFLVTITTLATLALGGSAAGQAQSAPAALPMLVLDTVKGTIEIELWPDEAPKSVAHILALVKRNFYRGLRFHWVNAAVAQIGDPATRDMTKKDAWGAGGSGTRIGVEEFSKKRFVRGSVGIAHRDGAKNGDSQFFIAKMPNAPLDGKFTMIGRVTRGMEVADRIQMADILRNATLK